MIGKIIGALVGREIDRRDGESGAEGRGDRRGRGWARCGAMGPLGLLLGGGYVAKKAYDRRRQSRDG